VVCEWYEVAGYRFGLRTTSEPFAAWIRYALEEYRTEPSGEELEAYPTYSVVVEDGARGEGRIGRRFHILYMGTWDVARTLDLGFLARCLLRQVDAIGHHAREDALFLESGTIDVEGRAYLVPTYLVPALSAARRRAEKMGVTSTGGMVAALDRGTGELVAPVSSLRVPEDALARLGEFVAGGSVDAHADRFVVEDGERRPLAGVIRPLMDSPLTRAGLAVEMLANVKNFALLGGHALHGLAKALAPAAIVETRWSSTSEMLQELARAGSPGLEPARVSP